MIPLDKDLQKVKSTIAEFGEITERILQYLPNVLSNSEEKSDYLIYSSEIAGTTKYIRPINKNLFLNNLDNFKLNFNKVKSTSISLDEKEVVVSVKTTSKDRMGKMFIDKILLERFVKHPQKVIGIFLNDVQRKEANNISFTLVSGLFMVYSKFLTQLEGVYYLDPPPNANKKPFSNYMKQFSELITTDLQQLLTS